MGLVHLSFAVDYIGSELKKQIIVFRKKAEEVSGETEEEQKYIKKRMRLLVERLGLTDDKLNLPFPIIDGKIGEQKDIRYHERHLTEWTTALRFLFIDCKHLIGLQNLIDCVEKLEMN